MARPRTRRIRRTADTPSGKPGGDATVSNARRKTWLVLLPIIVAAVGGYFLIRQQDSQAPIDRSKTLPPALAVEPGAARGFNLVLITLDTTRADRLGCYGHAAAETPTLDSLAREGVRFADAVTSVSITLASHSAMMTGLYPPNCGVRDNGLYVLDKKNQTLAETLSEQGYATAAFLASFVLDRRYGLDQGFDTYADEISLRYRQPGVRQATPQRPADAVVDDALAWLESSAADRSDKPLFMWVHLFDPHSPYTPPEPFATRFSHRLYDGEIAFMDQQIGRLLEGLRAHNLSDHTLLVLVGDHGEGLGQHHESTHSLLIYDSTMHVPLIMHCPAVLPAGRVVDDRVVATVDLLPTILDLLGVSAPSHDGLSLLQPAPADRAVYMETLAPRLNHGWSALHGLRTHIDKYIEAPTPEYYDLAQDPGELSNLLDQDVAVADVLADRLAALMSTFPEQGSEVPTITPDEDAIRKLQALGYVGGAATEVDEGPLPDPKDMLANWEQGVFEARDLVDQGHFVEAIPLVQSLLEKTPHDARLWNLLSMSQVGIGRLDDALASRMKTVELQPTDSNHWLALAHLQKQRGDLAGMKVALEQALKIEPDHGEAYLTLAQQAQEEGDLARAIALCEEARRRDPTRHTATSWSLQGYFYDQTGRTAEAEAAYQNAYAADPRDSGALLGLAKAAERAGRPEDVIGYASRITRGDPQWTMSRTSLARAHVALGQEGEAVGVMRELVEALPNQAWTHSNLGNVLYQIGRLDEAADAYRQAVQTDPSYAVGHYNLGQTLRRLGRLDEARQHLQSALGLRPGLWQADLELARIEAAAGDLDACAERVGRLLTSGATTLQRVKADPALAPLVADPRFEQLEHATRHQTPTP